MARKITYLFGAGASAHALPTIKSMYLRMRFFYELLNIAYDKLGESRTNSYKPERNRDFEEFLKLVELAGTPDVVIRLRDIKGEESALYRTFLTAYLLFEQFQDCDNEHKKLFTDEEVSDLWKSLTSKFKIDQEFTYHNQTVDPRYLSFLATLINPKESKVELPDNISLITWNYDHQIEMALKYLGEKTLDQLQRKYKVIPFTSEDDRNWEYQEIQESYSRSQIIKVNGTAGFIKAELWRTFDPTQESLCEDMWRRMLDLLYGIFGRGAKGQKLMFSWDREYKVLEECRKQAKERLSESEIVVVIGYSFPDFNRAVDKRIFNRFSGKLYLQDPNARDTLQKIRGVNPKIDTEPITNVSEFFIPNEFWE